MAHTYKIGGVRADGAVVDGDFATLAEAAAFARDNGLSFRLCEAGDCWIDDLPEYGMPWGDDIEAMEAAEWATVEAIFGW